MDVPPKLGKALWPVSRFIGYRPPEVNDESDSSDASSRGRMLPRSIHDKPAVASTSHKLATLRQNSYVQNIEFMILSFLGSFFGVALIATMSRASLFQRDGRNAPIVIGSFGAEAVILYAAPTSPLAQPRCVIGGNVVSAIIGVALAKGFVKLPGFVIGEIGYANWAAAALAISLSLLAMQLLKFTHPPGGATALLAVTLPAVYNLNWFYVADIAASSCIMLAWALIINNIGNRRYPLFWISDTVGKKMAKNDEKQSHQ